MSSIENFNYIEQMTGVKPDIKEMVRAQQARGIEIHEDQIDKKLQDLFQQCLLEGKISELYQLEKQFQRLFSIKPAELQILYTKIIMGIDQSQEVFKFLYERTGILPSQEIIQARYNELFFKSFDLEVIGAFWDKVGVPPPMELMQKKYNELFENYINSGPNYYYGDDEEPWDPSQENLQRYYEVIQFTGISPKFDRDYVMKLYEYCLTSGPKQHEKIHVIAQETGFVMNNEFIQKHLLDNHQFNSPVPFVVTNEMLDKHFSNLQNRTLIEYKRIYGIFGCFDYYQKLLKNLERDNSRVAKQQIIKILAAMGVRDMENEERYVAIKQKIMNFVEERSIPINKSMGEALAELVKRGDDDLLSYFASTLKERVKSAKLTDNERGVIGLSPIQDVALRTLFHVDNPKANEQLLLLVVESDLNPRVKSYILKNLLNEKKDFFPRNMRLWVEFELTSKKSRFQWENLKYFQSTIAIPSADLRKKTLGCLNDVFGYFTENNMYPTQYQAENCPNIPDDTFLPLLKFTRGNQVLLKKFNDLYTKIKTTVEKDSLLFGIVNSSLINEKIFIKVIDKLNEIDFLTEGVAEGLGTFLKTLCFLDTVEKRLGQSNDEVSTLFDSPIKSLGQLNEDLKQILVQKIKNVLPHEGVSAERIQSLWENWGNLEPVFIYAEKMSISEYAGTLKLLAEMVANMDAPNYEEWKRWRYDLQDGNVFNQVGKLTEQQLEVWSGDYFAELGDVLIATTPSDKPKQILEFIKGSLRDGHIYNVQIHDSDRHKFIQEKLALVYMNIAEHPEKKEIILSEAIRLLHTDIEKIDAIIQFSNLPKLEQLLSLFEKGINVPINAKTKKAISAFSQFLPKDKFQEIEKAYREAEKRELSTIDAEILIKSSTREFLMAKIIEIKQNYEEVLKTDVFEKHGLNREQLKNVGQFYQKRQELKALLDLYRIGALDVKKIATNRISDRIDKKGESLTKVIEGLKLYFKDNPTFIQDLDNISSVIAQSESLGDKRRLAMIVSDSPQLLLQVGKYPLGCGSCQNYEGSPQWNVALAGYVADAHIKVAYLVDLNKLPEQIRSDIETKGFENVKGIIPQQNLLEASIARSIIKIVKISGSAKPALFVEPTYSSVNKGDLSMNRYFNIFLELMIADPMSLRLVRGGGDEKVQVPNSRNPGGQYEDCAAGNAGHAGMGIIYGDYTMSARFVDRFTPVNKADRELAERISMSLSFVH